MRLVRYGTAGCERPAMLDGHDQLRDLSTAIDDIVGLSLSREALRNLAAIDVETLPVVQGAPRLGPPIGRVGKIVAIGLNYTDHAREASLPIPAEPVVFLKATSSICGPNDDIVIPRGSKKTDWEVELGIVIGERASHVGEDAALDHVAGYLLVNDVSEREYQLERGGTWDKGKGCDTFGPLGPWFVTSDEIDDPQNLAMWLDVNGERRQTGHTSTMIFGVRTIVSYVSRFMTLDPGDIVITGTPAGVGLGIKPQPRFLKAGDVVELGIDKLGTQRQRFVDRES